MQRIGRMLLGGTNDNVTIEIADTAEDQDYIANEDSDIEFSEEEVEVEVPTRQKTRRGEHNLTPSMKAY
jgi:hypothetical protein